MSSEAEADMAMSNSVPAPRAEQVPGSDTIGDSPSASSDPLHPQVELASPTITAQSSSSDPHLSPPSTATSTTGVEPSSSISASASLSASTPTSTPTSTPIIRPRPSRLSSQFASRPAPPSPASSRRASQIASPTLSRDRASSTGSSGAGSTSHTSTTGLGISNSNTLSTGRRVSNSSGLTSRASSKARPRSSLGTLILSADSPDQDTTPGGVTPSFTAAMLGSPNLAETSVPEESVAAIATNSETNGAAAFPPPPRDTQVIIVRDFAFPASDERHHAVLPPPPSRPPSEGGLHFRSSPSSSSKRGWSGLGLLSWRGFLSRSKSDNRAGGEDEGDSGDEDEDEDDIPVSVEHPDDYAFESSSEAEENGEDNLGMDGGEEEGEDEEPFGLYRAAYVFVAEGEHEISVREGEVVEVRGRGGGEGWVVAVKLGGMKGEGKFDGMEGLVPESYLEKVHGEHGETPVLGEAAHDGEDAEEIDKARVAEGGEGEGTDADKEGDLPMRERGEEATRIT